MKISKQETLSEKDIKIQIQTSDDFAVRCLIELYNRQTADESIK